MVQGKPRLPAEQRRALIIDAARDAFLQAGEGMKGVSTRAIAQRAGVDEALIYRHFGTKENLYLEAVAAPVEQLVNRLIEQAQQMVIEDEPVDRVQREWDLSFQYLMWLFELPSGILRAVGMLLIGDRDRAEAFYQRVLGPGLRRLDELVSGELRYWQHGKFSVPLSVRMALTTAVFLIIESETSGQPLDRETAAREITDLLIYGMVKR
jgi:AcrR family transcriptional regulator